ncbi:10232_t:CDS:2, partial [Funneliformis mosseae]
MEYISKFTDLIRRPPSPEQINGDIEALVINESVEDMVLPHIVHLA